MPARLMLPVRELIVPVLTSWLVIRFRAVAACITGAGPLAPAGSALAMELPAVRVRLPALRMTPALTILSMAVNDRLRLEIVPLMPGSPAAGRTDDIMAPCWLNMFRALMSALVAPGLVETR